MEPFQSPDQAPDQSPHPTPLAAADHAILTQSVRLLATDMDGTLTRHERFTPELLHALGTLHAQGHPAVVVTGRSAGWVSAIAHYLPIAGAIAENGGVYLPAPTGHTDPAPELLTPLPDLAAHRQSLRDMFHQLQAQCPQLAPAADNAFRLTDWTFGVADLPTDTLHHLDHLCQQTGWGFVYSTVQCHIFPAGQTKAAGLQRVLAQHFPDITPAQVLTLGDSPNDESLFDRRQFPHSVGVANISPYLPRLIHRPTYIANGTGVDGMVETCQALGWLA